VKASGAALPRIILTSLAIALCAVLLALALPWLAGWALGSADRGELPGPYGAGFRRISIVSPRRAETLGESPSGMRELMVSVYYPAADGSGEGPWPYADLGEMSALGPPRFLARPLNLRRSRNADPYPGSYAVVLFSPGLEGPVAAYASVLENLASLGFVVLAVDHPFTTAAVRFPDGTLLRQSPAGAESLFSGTREEQDARRSEVSEIWALDQIDALDALLDGEGGWADLAGIIDPERIGAFGHSFGGQAAAAMMHLDPRVKSGMNWDGSILYKPVREAGLTRPWAQIASDPEPPWKWMEESGTDLSEWIDLIEEADFPAVLFGHPESLILQIVGSRHEGFAIDFLLMKPLLPLIIGERAYGTIKPEAMLSILTEASAAWFLQTLDGTDGRLDEIIAAFPEIRRGFSYAEE
jgi:dienelactone hydrolase